MVRDIAVDTRLCTAPTTRPTVECLYPAALLQEELRQMLEQAASRNGIQLTADNQVTWSVVAASLGIVSGTPEAHLFGEYELHEPAEQGALATRPYVPETFGRERVRLIIQSQGEETRNCYLEALRENPDLAGRLMVRFTVLPSGRVSDGREPTESTVDAGMRRGVALAFPPEEGELPRRGVGPGGLLRAPFVVASTMGPTGLEECILNIVQSLVFPARTSPMPVIVHHPFVFAPEE